MERAALTAARGAGGARRVTRAVPVGVAGVLLVVVALAGEARRVSSEGVVHPLGLRVIGDVVLSVLAMLLLAGMVLRLAVLLSRRGRQDAEDEQDVEVRPLAWWERLLAAALPIAVALLVAGLLARSMGDGSWLRDSLGGWGSSGGSGSLDPERSLGAGVDWLVVGAVAVLTVGVLTAVLATGGRRGPRVAPRARSEGVALAAVGAVGLEELLEEPDPRRAVIRAYGAMTAQLGVWGLPRRPSETPFEFLERTLVGLGASAGAARRLTVLFERARFSDHPITGAHKTEAVDALRRLHVEPDT